MIKVQKCTKCGEDDADVAAEFNKEPMVVGVVLVLWAFAFLEVFASIKTGINWGFPIAIMVTLIVAAAKVVEYLTRPAQTAHMASKTHTWYDRLPSDS